MMSKRQNSRRWKKVPLLIDPGSTSERSPFEADAVQSGEDAEDPDAPEVK
jgi:hypothetical protein